MDHKNDSAVHAPLCELQGTSITRRDVSVPRGRSGSLTPFRLLIQIGSGFSFAFLQNSKIINKRRGF